jgi:hypothetical protein
VETKGLQAIKYALSHGYIVNTEEGYVLNKKGRQVGSIGKRGYINISLPLGNKKYTVVFLHKLLSYALWGEDAFIAGLQVRHLNSNKLDNRAENLSLGTSKDNHSDRTVEEKTETCKKGWRGLSQEQRDARCNNISIGRKLSPKGKAKSIILEVTCPECGVLFSMPKKVFERKSKTNKIGVFCSVSCAAKARYRLRGIDHLGRFADTK